jgi:hypothetical protein
MMLTTSNDAGEEHTRATATTRQPAGAADERARRANAGETPHALTDEEEREHEQAPALAAVTGAAQAARVVVVKI